MEVGHGILALLRKSPRARSEREIAKDLRVARSTVRDWLQVLRELGQVRSFPPLGFYSPRHEAVVLRTWAEKLSEEWRRTLLRLAVRPSPERWKRDPVQEAAWLLPPLGWGRWRDHREDLPVIVERALLAVEELEGCGPALPATRRMRSALGDYEVGRELLRRHPRFPSKAWDWHPPDEPEPGGTPLWVVWDGPEGVGENAEVFVPHGPAFRRGVPVQLPEAMAKRLVETAEKKAAEAEDPKPAHFRYATVAEDKAAEVDDPKPAHFTLLRNAVPVSP